MPPSPAEFPLVLGLDTFGDHVHDERGRPLSHAETIRSVVEQGVLADHVGVDFFGIGEHHTDDFPMPPRPMSRPARSSGRTGPRPCAASARSAASQRPAKSRSSTTQGRMEPSTSDRRKRWRKKFVTNLDALGATRFDLKYGMPGLTHEALMANIELYGAEVIPRVRELVANPLHADLLSIPPRESW